MASQNEQPKEDAVEPGLAHRARRALGRSATWVTACVMAGLAAVITSISTNIGKSAVQSVQTKYCGYRINKTPDSSRFRVVVSQLKNDKDHDIQERIAAQLVPTSFAVLRGCTEGPSTFSDAGANFDERARTEATKQLTALSADVLIFGRVEGDKVALRFADRDGYCSQVAKVLPIADLDQEAARSAFARALGDRVIRALVSDCEARKMDALSLGELQGVADKVDLLTGRYGATAEPDVKMNLWTYRAWIQARLSERRDGKGGAQHAVEAILARAPDAFAKAASLWGLALFGERANEPQLSRLARDEGYIAYRTWDESSPAWVSMAMLAADRIEQDHANDPNWRLRHYDRITDRAAGNGPDFVPMPDGDYYRALYRFGIAAVEAPDATRRDVENAVSVLSSLLDNKIAKKQVPVTTNSIRYQLAAALIRSAGRDGAASRIVRAKELIDYIEAHPDDSTELTPSVMADLRRKLTSECRRRRCQV